MSASLPVGDRGPLLPMERPWGVRPWGLDRALGQNSFNGPVYKHWTELHYTGTSHMNWTELEPQR